MRWKPTTVDTFESHCRLWIVPLLGPYRWRRCLAGIYRRGWTPSPSRRGRSVPAAVWACIASHLSAALTLAAADRADPLQPMGRDRAPQGRGPCHRGVHTGDVHALAKSTMPTVPVEGGRCTWAPPPGCRGRARCWGSPWTRWSITTGAHHRVEPAPLDSPTVGGGCPTWTTPPRRPAQCVRWWPLVGWSRCWRSTWQRSLRGTGVWCSPPRMATRCAATGSERPSPTPAPPLGSMTDRAGERKLSFHALRHRFAWVLLTGSHQAFTVGRLLGHGRTETTTEVYGHLIPGVEEAARDAMEAAWGSMAATGEMAPVIPLWPDPPTDRAGRRGCRIWTNTGCFWTEAQLDPALSQP